MSKSQPKTENKANNNHNLWYLLTCPYCYSLLNYKYTRAKTRARKYCVKCGKRFDITDKTTIKTFETFEQCKNGHNILSYYIRNAHSQPSSLENILTKFREVLLEGLKHPNKILEKNDGRGATPHTHNAQDDQFSLYGLPLYAVEIDRLHWQTFLSPTLYHRLLDSGYTPKTDFGDIEIKESFGTIYIRTTGQIEGYTDFSKPHYVASIEGIISFFKQLCDHKGLMKFKIHETEFTVKINRDSELAETFMKKFNKPKVAFLESNFKTYYDDKGTLRNETYSASDMILGIEQQFSEPLSKGKINAVVFGNNDNTNENVNAGLQDSTLLIQQMNQKLDYHTTAITELQKSTTAQQKATTELIIHSQDMKRDNELSHEQQRDQSNRIVNMLYEKHTSFFEHKCDLIIQNLTERDVTTVELSTSLGQARQGIYRYLTHLMQEGVIESYQVMNGKRGRPQIKFRLKENHNT